MILVEYSNYSTGQAEWAKTLLEQYRRDPSKVLLPVSPAAPGQRRAQLQGGAHVLTGLIR